MTSWVDRRPHRLSEGFDYPLYYLCGADVYRRTGLGERGRAANRIDPRRGNATSGMFV